MTPAQRLHDLRTRRNISLLEVADATGESRAGWFWLESCSREAIRKLNPARQQEAGAGAWFRQSSSRSKAQVWKLEIGVSDSPSIRLGIRLAEVCRVSAARLFAESPEAASDGPEAMAMFRDLKRLDACGSAVVWTLADRLRRPPVGDRLSRPYVGRSPQPRAGRVLHSLEAKA